jgi:hypothetical protein
MKRERKKKVFENGKERKRDSIDKWERWRDNKLQRKEIESILIMEEII